MADKQDDKSKTTDPLEDIANASKPAESPIVTPPTKEEAEAEKANVAMPAETPPAAPAPVAAADDTLISAPAADAAPSATGASAPNTPAVVTEPEVDKGSAAPVENNEKLAEEIEVLTGEIQALEAKIERLTSGASATPSAPLSSPDVAPIAAETMPEPAKDSADMPKNEAAASDIPTPPPVVPANDVDFVNKPKEDAGSPVPVNTKPAASTQVNDIFPNATPPAGGPSQPAEQSQSGSESVETADSGNSGLAIIGEVVAVFGVVIFTVLAVSPFFREMLGEDTYEAIQQIGWLSALGTLGLGFLLLLFVKGKTIFKILLFVLLLLAAVLFAAINEYGFISPVSSYLEPLLEFYR